MGFDLHQLLAENRQLISDTWNFFLSVHLAIFGMVFLVSSRLSLRERGLLIVAYLVFAYINFMAQYENYAAQNAILDQIRMLPPGPDGDTARALALGAEPAWIAAYLREGYALVAIASIAIIILSSRERDL